MDPNTDHKKEQKYLQHAQTFATCAHCVVNSAHVKCDIFLYASDGGDSQSRADENILISFELIELIRN